MNSVRSITALLVGCAAGILQAATLERLSLDDMVAKSTDIVRGRVGASSARYVGAAGRGIVYTHYAVQVVERWKGSGGTNIDIAVPGGSVQGLRQTFAGAPSLTPGAEYVFFLWTSRSGLTQIIGLSQGLMNLKLDGSGKSVMFRSAVTEAMVDAYGQPVTDQGFSMSIGEFRNSMARYGLAGVEK